MNVRSILLTAAACGLMGCGPSVQDIYMSKDGGGAFKATRFTSGDELHLFMIAHGGQRGSKMHIRIDGLPFNFDYYPWPNRDKIGKVNVDVKFYLYKPDDMGPLQGGATDGMAGSETGAGGEGSVPEVEDLDEESRRLYRHWPVGHFVTHVSLDGEEVADLPFDVVSAGF